MLNSRPLNKMLFVDIETVPQEKSFFDMTQKKQELFIWRFKKEYAELGLGRAEHYIQEALSKGKSENDALLEMQADDVFKTESLYRNKASLFAEFGKIICISVGFIKTPLPVNLNELDPKQDLEFKTLSYSGDDEKKLLQDFCMAFNSVISKKFEHTHHFAAHNGKVFDFPYIAKRLILNGLPLPEMFDFVDKKPWDLNYFVDTKEAWQFTVRDGATSLDLLCECFGVASSKDDIKGSEVRDVYYEQNDLKRIVVYCEKDVVALATVYLRMKSLANNLVLE